MGQIRQKLGWTVLGITAVLAVLGVYHEQIFAQEIWSDRGWIRILRFARAFGLVSTALIIVRPSWFLPAAGLAALAYTIWFVGPLAPLAVFFFAGSCWLLGRRLFPGRDAVPSTLVGLAAWMLVVFVSVHFPINTPYVYAVAIAVPWIFGARDVFAAVRAFQLPKSTRTECVGSAIFIFVLATHWLVSLQPETSGDGLSVHMAAPMLILFEHKWDFDFLRFSWALMPMGVDWIYTAQYFLGGEAGARLLNFVILALNSWTLYRLGSRWTTKTKALLTSGLFCSTPIVQNVTGGLMGDNAWAAFVFNGLIALMDGDLVIAGALIGAAFMVKVGTAAFLLPAIVLGAVHVGREKKARVAWIGAALLLLFALPTYINAWVISGNPIYPFKNHIFKAPGMDTGTPFEDARFRKSLSWRMPYDLTFRSGEFYEGQKGGLGFQYFLLALPALIATRRRQNALLLGVAFVGGMITLSTEPNLRYLYPATLVASSALTELIPTWAVGLLIGINLTVLPAAGWGFRDFRLFSKRDAVQARKIGFPEHELIDYLNEHAPREPVVFLGGDSIAGFHGRAYTDTWHTFAFWIKLSQYRNAGELLSELQRLNVRYAVAPISKTTGNAAADDLMRTDLSEPILTSDRVGLYRIMPPEPKEPPKPIAVPPPPPPVVGRGTYDHRNLALEFNGVWLHRVSVNGPARGTVSFSNNEGAAARLRFIGDTIVYKYTKAYNRGIVLVLIDGKEVSRIDQYAPGIEWQQETRFEGLGPSRHIIEVRVTRDKNEQSEDYFAEVDEFQVMP